MASWKLTSWPASTQVPHDLPPGTLKLAHRVGLFLAFLAINFLVFAVGHSAWVSYESRPAARAVLSLALLATTVGFYRNERLRPFWPVSLAYLAVSLGFLLAHAAADAFLVLGMLAALPKIA